jgi:SAM-dependent methyltransferase
MRLGAITGTCVAALTAFAADRVFPPFSAVQPVLATFGTQLPAALKNADEAKWTAWSRQQDLAIRARLEQGDRDSMVNLLLFGTSFTARPRIRIEDLAQASKSGLLRARVDDLVQGLQVPGTNERLMFLRNLLRGQGIDPEISDDRTGVFILQNLERVLKENVTFSQQIQQGNRTQVFRDRGVSLDTTILPNFGIEETLRDMKDHGAVGEHSMRRVAVIGPGLDFTDWDSGFDYYPQQTIQPFALYDSLLRLALAKGGSLDITVFDISPRVIDHLQRARDGATQGRGYLLHLPRGAGRRWTAGAAKYWSTFGDRAGEAVAPIPLPAVLSGTETRAVRIRPDAVLACQPVDLNIVLQRLDLAPAERFDLVIATNVFVYYQAFEQALALENVAAMLKPGGFLLSNEKPTERRGASVRPAGSTTVWYSDEPKAGDSVVWYKKSPN